MGCLETVIQAEVTLKLLMRLQILEEPQTKPEELEFTCKSGFEFGVTILNCYSAFAHEETWH